MLFGVIDATPAYLPQHSRYQQFLRKWRGVEMVRAGIGEHQATVISGPRDGTPLTLHKHYISVDAVGWFVNQESGWFTDKIATGTLSIRIGAGESYDVALGVYELKGGAKIAPVFGRPVLPARAFRGGPITVQAVISGVKKSNGLGNVLKGVADAALGVVGTMVQTASLTGPSHVLGAAGGALVGGVRDLLNAQENNLRLFDPTTGIEKTLEPTDILAPTMYVLLHRGTKLEPKNLKVVSKGGGEVLTYDGKALEDGAWLLLRFRRSTEYPTEPTWLKKFRDWVDSVEKLGDELDSQAITVEAARARLTSGGDGSPSVYDVYRELYAEVRSDGLLTSAESGSYLGVLRAVRLLALQLVGGGTRAGFDAAMAQLRTGSLTDPQVRKAVAEGNREADVARGAAPAETKAPGLPADLDVSLPLDDYGRFKDVLSRKK
jgi:hypothetical protein